MSMTEKLYGYVSETGCTTKYDCQKQKEKAIKLFLMILCYTHWISLLQSMKEASSAADENRYRDPEPNNRQNSGNSHKMEVGGGL